MLVFFKFFTLIDSDSFKVGKCHIIKLLLEEWEQREGACVMKVHASKDDCYFSCIVFSKCINLSETLGHSFYTEHLVLMLEYVVCVFQSYAYNAGQPQHYII